MTQNPIGAPSMLVFGVTDIEASAAFYRDTLGLKLNGQNSEFAFFGAGPVSIVLNRPLGRAVSPVSGATELVFPVASVSEAHRYFLERGCAFASEPRNVTGESWAATLRDPDGHRITLFGPK